MKIAVIGTGYVGLVTGTCLAETGNDVIGIDKDAAEDRPAAKRARLPIYEPGLAELVQPQRRGRRLHFTTDLAGGHRPRPSWSSWPSARRSAERRLGRSVQRSGPSVEPDRPAIWPRRHRRHQEHRAGRHQRGAWPSGCAS